MAGVIENMKRKGAPSNPSLEETKKYPTLEPKQKVRLIELLLIVNTVFVAFDLGKNFNGVMYGAYLGFSLWCILYFIMIQKKIDTERYKETIWVLSLGVAIFFWFIVGFIQVANIANFFSSSDSYFQYLAQSATLGVLFMTGIISLVIFMALKK